MSWNNQSETGWLKNIYDRLGTIYDKLVAGITTTPGSGTQNVNVVQVNSATPTGTGAIEVQGATGAPATTRPVWIGGSNGAGGMAGVLIVDSRLWVQAGEQTAGADGITNTAIFPLGTNGVARVNGSTNWLFNGATLDQQRNNTGETVLASAARTIATNGPDMTNYNARGLHLIIDVTAFTAGSITITIQGKDPVSGKYYTILTSAALAAVATTVLRVYPDATIAANVSINDVLPRTWRAIVAVSTADSVTYSIGANLVL